MNYQGFGGSLVPWCLGGRRKRNVGSRRYSQIFSQMFADFFADVRREIIVFFAPLRLGVKHFSATKSRSMYYTLLTNND
jgi:hypothetical protein